MPTPNYLTNVSNLLINTTNLPISDIPKIIDLITIIETFL
jgi:hypothetical protein